MRALHIGLYLLGGLLLVGGIFIEKTGLQFVLHIAIGAEGKSLLVLTTAIESDKVTCDVLDMRLSTLLHPLPGTCAQTAHTWRFTITSAILGNLMQGMDGNEDHIIVLIDNLDNLQPGISIGNTEEATKASYAMIDVNHIIAYLELLKFLERKCHPTAACAVALKMVPMKPVEYLMICEATQMQIIVYKTGMQSMVDRNETERKLPVTENSIQAVGLTCIFREDIDVIFPVVIILKSLEEEVEVLVKDGLGKRMRLKHHIGFLHIRRREHQHAELLQLGRKEIGRREQSVPIQQNLPLSGAVLGSTLRNLVILALRLLYQKSLSRETICPYLLHTVTYIYGIARDK